MTGLAQTRIDNPGYPDPSGPNLHRSGSSPLVPSVTRYGDDMRTPYTAQATPELLDTTRLGIYGCRKWSSQSKATETASGVGVCPLWWLK